VSPGAVFCPKVAAIVPTAFQELALSHVLRPFQSCMVRAPIYCFDAFNCKGVDCAGAMSLALF
jgi:hypothetical protein